MRGRWCSRCVFYSPPPPPPPPAGMLLLVYCGAPCPGVFCFVVLCFLCSAVLHWAGVFAAWSSVWWCVVSCYLVHLPPHGGLLIGGPGNGAPPPSKSSLYAIIYSPRAETKHTSKVYDAAPLNDRLRELIRTVIFVLINHGCFAKLGPLQGFNFFNTIH